MYFCVGVFVFFIVFVCFYCVCVFYCVGVVFLCVCVCVNLKPANCVVMFAALPVL